MPLQQWAALHAAVQSQRLEDLALDVSVTHAGNPRRMRQRLMNASKDALKQAIAGPRKPLAADPERLKRVARGAGIDVKVGMDEESDGNAR